MNPQGSTISRYLQIFFVRGPCNASTRCSNWRLQSIGHVVITWDISVQKEMNNEQWFGTTAHSEGHSRRLLAVLLNTFDKPNFNPSLAQQNAYVSPAQQPTCGGTDGPQGSTFCLICGSKKTGHQLWGFQVLQGLHSRWHWWSWRWRWDALRNLMKAGQMSFLFRSSLLVGLGHRFWDINLYEIYMNLEFFVFTPGPMTSNHAHDSPLTCWFFQPGVKLQIPLWMKTRRHLRHRDACPSRIKTHDPIGATVITYPKDLPT